MSGSRQEVKDNRKVNKPKIKIGDLVRIVNPQIFVRCGYPLCIADVSKSIDKRVIIDCLVQAEVGSKEEIERIISYYPHHKLQRAYREILRGISLAVMISKRFGGSERKIYTEEKPELTGKIVKVESKRQVVTGDRYSGCGPGYYGDEAEGPSLENQKRHTLIKFWPIYYDQSSEVHSAFLCCDDEGLEIEQVHVEKVEQ